MSGGRRKPLSSCRINGGRATPVHDYEPGWAAPRLCLKKDIVFTGVFDYWAKVQKIELNFKRIGPAVVTIQIDMT
jgi:hypothetical protein